MGDILSLFSLEGVETIGASSASEAVSVFKNNKDVIGVVICDIMMRKPKSPLLSEYLANRVETGIALSQWFKSEKPKVSIIGCSATSRGELSRSWFEKYACGYVSKPLSSNLEEIFKLIRDVRKKTNKRMSSDWFPRCAPNQPQMRALCSI